MPQCGYSGTLVNILQSLSVPFETVDVLADERIRQGIKASNEKKEYRAPGPARPGPPTVVRPGYFVQGICILRGDVQ